MASDPRPTQPTLSNALIVHQPRWHSLWQTYFADAEPLWVTGWALLLVVIVRFSLRYAMHFPGKTNDWALYLALGTLFPAIVALLTVSIRARRSIAPSTQFLHGLLVFFFALTSIVLMVTGFQPYLLIFAAGQVIAVCIVSRRQRYPLSPAFVIIGFGITFLSWLGAARLFWWGADNSIGIGRYDNWVFGSIYAFLIFVASFALVLGGLFPAKPTKLAAKQTAYWVRSVLPSIVTVAVIGIESIRAVKPAESLSTAYQHWGAYIGPATMVRQGGWLLWDVLAQYGFLSTLSIAFFPAHSAWQSLYILSGLAHFCSACFIFFVLRSLRPGWVNHLFASLVSIAATFFVAGLFPLLWGTNTVLPSAGAFRFIWCYALLALLLLEMRIDKGCRVNRPMLIAGSFAWLIGTFWSAESAAYCAAIWIPAYLLLVARLALQTDTAPQSLARKLRIAAPWLLLLPALLIAAMSGITGFYLLRLGHVPDWRMYTEAISVYATTEFSWPLNLGEAACGLFVLFCALSTLAAFLLREGLMHRAIPLVVGSWGALWATSSYFIGRSAPSNVTNLSALFCAVIAIMLLVMTRFPTPGHWSTLLRLSLTPILVVELTLGFGNFGAMRDYLRAPNQGYQPQVEQTFPVLIDPSAAMLLDKAGIQPADPLVYFDLKTYVLLPARSVQTQDGPHLVFHTGSWLPNVPLIPFVTVSPERNALFMDRFARRTHRSGWLLQTRQQPYTSLPWFAAQLARDYRPGVMLEEGDWQIIWFQYDGPAS